MNELEAKWNELFPQEDMPALSPESLEEAVGYFRDCEKIALGFIETLENDLFDVSEQATELEERVEDLESVSYQIKDLNTAVQELVTKFCRMKAKT